MALPSPAPVRRKKLLWGRIGSFLAVYLGGTLVSGILFGGEAAFTYLLVLQITLAICGVIWFAGERRRRLRAVGHCECGYDLRETPDRCPECGRYPRPRRPWFTREGEGGS